MTKELAPVTPMDLIHATIEKGADPDVLAKMMDLQERYEAREARNAYVAAMANFQEHCPTIDKTLTAHNSKYAGLAETLEQIRGLLSENGLSHSWRTDQTEGQISVTCTVTHIQGHSESTTMTAQADTTGSKNSIQAIGSTVTYLQRYSLFSILGLASREMDDDGNSVGVITDEQRDKLKSMIEEADADIAKFCQWLKVKSLAKIRANDFQRACAMLEKKRVAK